MTGYAREHRSQDDLELEIEIKSVNSRYLDLRLYLPRELSFYEYEVRKCITQQLSRGAMEVRMNLSDHRPPRLQLNKSKLLKYKEMADAAASVLAKEASVSIEFLLQEPGVLENENNLAEDVLLAEMLKETLNRAVQQLIKCMEEEALKMREVLTAAMINIMESINNVRGLLVPFKNELYENMLIRVKELIGSHHLENLEQRLIQELAIYVDKYDIGEELSRLESHYETFMEALNIASDNGKTLNFIMQEMQREANTLGSKFSNSKSFPFILILKEEIENCREIVQNVA